MVSLRMSRIVFAAKNFTGEKCLRMRRDINHVVNFRKSHWLRGKIPAKCCQDERRNSSVFFQWQCCGFVATARDRKLFWSKFLAIYVV